MAKNMEPSQTDLVIQLVREYTNTSLKNEVGRFGPFADQVNTFDEIENDVVIRWLEWTKQRIDAGGKPAAIVEMETRGSEERAALAKIVRSVINAHRYRQ